MSEHQPYSLRPMSRQDLPFFSALAHQDRPEEDLWEGFEDAGRFERRLNFDGFLAPEDSLLVIRRSDVAVGFVTWTGVRHGGVYSLCWSVGIYVAPDARNQGAGTYCHRAVVEYLHRTTTVERIQAMTATTNAPERHVLEKCNFQLEGILRCAQWTGGGWVDFAVYARLRHTGRQSVETRSRH